MKYQINITLSNKEQIREFAPYFFEVRDPRYMHRSGGITRCLNQFRHEYSHYFQYPYLMGTKIKMDYNVTECS